MKERIKSLKPESWFLLIIIFTASVLRLWRFWDFDYLHDELSALTRLDYDSWAEFVQVGIKPDGHPAGVQVFLKVLTYLFNLNPIVVRIPFVLLGILSVYQIFKLGKEWYSTNVGLLSAAFLAVIQYGVFHSIVARPYAPGLLLSLLLMRIWTRIFLFKRTEWKVFVMYAIVLSATAYIHYFALLFGALLSLIGCFWLRRDILIKYLVAGLLSFVLYLPHFDIFLFQLNTEGLVWLNAPKPSFIINYFHVVSNHSVLLIGFVCLSALFFCIKGLSKFNSLNLKKSLTLLILFGALYGIGYWYSVEKTPVLQSSVLLFGLPALILLVFSFWNKQGGYKIGVPIILMVGIYSLAVNRNHFEWFFENPTKTFFELSSASSESLNVGRHEYEVADFYREQLGREINYYPLDRDCTTVAEYQSLLKQKDFKEVVIADLYQYEVGLTLAYFPFVKYNNQGVGFEYSVLQKKEASSLYYKKNDLIKALNIDTNQTYNEGYFFNYLINCDSVLNAAHDRLDFFIELEADTSADRKIVLVTQTEGEEEHSNWFGARSKSMTEAGVSRFYLVNSYEIPYDEDSLKNVTLKSYLWNPGKTPFRVKKFGYGVRPGNINQYAIYDELR